MYLLLAFFGAFMLWYIYSGYELLLNFWVKGRNEAAKDKCQHDLTISIILPVYNEEAKIERKIRDILEQRISSDFEIIVVSDGSTDQTDHITRKYAEKGVRLIKTGGRVGKSLAQNVAVAEATGDILILTDVDVSMGVGCINELIEAFYDPDVGCVSANLEFLDLNRSDTGSSVSWYWGYELRLRQKESILGMLATASGPAMAIRRDLWRNLEARYGDDCVLPLDVILQGKKVVHANNAFAYDVHFENYQKEYRARVRMTMRNWSGTWSRSILLNPLKYGKISFGLFSHKILRWLSPLFLVIFLFGSLSMLSTYNIYLLIIIVLGLPVYSLAPLILKSTNFNLPYSGALFSFLLANVAFAIGLSKLAWGGVVEIYDNF